MRDADCGVFPARGEAWNLELLEMMSCGRLVIATDFAGHTEYADHENALLIQIDELEPAADPVWNTVFTERKTGEWAHLGEPQSTSWSSTCARSTPASSRARPYGTTLGSRRRSDSHGRRPPVASSKGSRNERNRTARRRRRRDRPVGALEAISG